MQETRQKSMSRGKFDWQRQEPRQKSMAVEKINWIPDEEATKSSVKSPSYLL